MPKFLFNILALISLVVNVFFVADFSYASEPAQKIVRIGYAIPVNYKGNPDTIHKSGYTYEYLLMIASFNNWRYVYVYRPWSDLLEDLAVGRIDILDNVSYTPERAKQFDFSFMPIRSDAYYLFVPEGQKDKYQNKEDFFGKRIGVGRDTTVSIQLRQWNKDNGLNLQIIEYPDYESRVLALRQRKVDAIADFTARMDTTKGYMVPVLRFGEDNSYIAVSRRRPDLLKQTNQALSMTSTYIPDYKANLKEKYILKNSQSLILSSEERAWFKQHGTIRIGFMDKMVPFISTGPDGQARGMFKDLINYGFKKFNLNVPVTYVPYQDMQQLIKDLQEHKIDAAIPIYDTPWEAENKHILLTPNVVRMKMYVLSRNGEPLNQDTLFAVVKSLPPQERYIRQFFPGHKIKYFESPDALIEAVKNGDAGAAVVDPYFISLYIQNSDLQVTSLEDSEDLTIAVNPDNHPLFLTMSRMGELWGDSNIADSLLKHTDEAFTPGFAYYVQHNYGKVIVIAIIGTGVLTALVGTIIFRNRQKEAAERMASIDFLTGLPNRRAYEEKLLEEEHVHSEQFAVAVFDINGLKKANDTLGHAAGDELIKTMANFLMNLKDESKEKLPFFQGYRVGGDEFVALMQVDDRQRLLLHQSLLDQMNNWKGALNPRISVSVGVSSRSEFPNSSVNELVRIADNRMYQDKLNYYRSAKMKNNYAGAKAGM